MKLASEISLFLILKPIFSSIFHQPALTVSCRQGHVCPETSFICIFEDIIIWLLVGNNFSIHKSVIYFDYYCKLTCA